MDFIVRGGDGGEEEEEDEEEEGRKEEGGGIRGERSGGEKRGRDKRESSIDSKRVCSITNIYDIHAVNKEKE